LIGSMPFKVSFFWGYPVPNGSLVQLFIHKDRFIT
jgi:hypothetical protein